MSISANPNKKRIQLNHFQSCVSCSQSHLKCSGTVPCERCTKNRTVCISRQNNDRKRQKKVNSNPNELKITNTNQNSTSNGVLEYSISELIDFDFGFETHTLFSLVEYYFYLDDKELFVETSSGFKDMLNIITFDGMAIKTRMSETSYKKISPVFTDSLHFMNEEVTLIKNDGGQINGVLTIIILMRSVNGIDNKQFYGIFKK